MAQRSLALFRRRFVTFLTILSLLLCLATVALWARSYWRDDSLQYVSVRNTKLRGFGMDSTLGELSLFVAEETGSNNDQGWHFYNSTSTATGTLRNWADGLRPPGPLAFRFLGFSNLTISQTSPPYSLRGFCFPHWFLALVFAILPAMRLRSILRMRRQHRLGLCPHCGYDLRATPDRCPECGRQPGA